MTICIEGSVKRILTLQLTNRVSFDSLTTAFLWPFLKIVNFSNFSNQQIFYNETSLIIRDNAVCSKVCALRSRKGCLNHLFGKVNKKKKIELQQTRCHEFLWLF